MMTAGFIGTGNMGGALAKAVSKAPEYFDILLSNRTAAKAEQLADEIGGTVSDNKTIAEQADYIFLGVKPQMMRDMLSGISDILAERTDDFVLITMAAGLDMDDICAYAGGKYPVIRIMPNTPAAIGEGMTLYCANDMVSEEQLSTFCSMLSAAGRLSPLSEKLMAAGAAVSGCGPAFVYMFIEALADGGVKCGLPRAAAMEYAAQMVKGSAEMILQSGQHPGALKDAVCSPGGTTIEGVITLEKNAFRGTVAEAVTASYEKNFLLK